MKAGQNDKLAAAHGAHFDCGVTVYAVPQTVVEPHVVVADCALPCASGDYSSGDSVCAHFVSSCLVLGLSIHVMHCVSYTNRGFSGASYCGVLVVVTNYRTCPNTGTFFISD